MQHGGSVEMLLHVQTEAHQSYVLVECSELSLCHRFLITSVTWLHAVSLCFPPGPFLLSSRNEVTRVANRNRPYVNDNNRLVLTWSHPQHSGQYRCNAMNPFGVNTTYFNITIVYPSECGVVSRVSGRGVCV